MFREVALIVLQWAFYHLQKSAPVTYHDAPNTNLYTVELNLHVGSWNLEPQPWLSFLVRQLLERYIVGMSIAVDLD